MQSYPSSLSTYPFHSTIELDLTLHLLNPTFPSLDLNNTRTFLLLLIFENLEFCCNLKL
ncbi:hypothetical protein HanXRQr2_Chr02g0062501 [Helianthus annuus]|uniref:Uncharacterized protein n=1 Tax=Helianthus annuus TaxID=4232 RepID=A0A9K3NZD5_HELAN|nr:hypothetical protein HanXRQr2_Chr02g0062501 [Helianthus annuus]KAJ0951552.1 hypothetical protein HanPSC8_Chr02g0061451 [Helianthus annuus]